MKILTTALAAAAAMAVIGLPAAAVAQDADAQHPMQNDNMHHHDMDGHHRWHHRHHAWHRHCWTKWHHHHRVRICRMVRWH